MGRKVRLLLVDGTMHGSVTGEVINWSGEVLGCPRTRLGELSKRSEIESPGIYVLDGEAGPSRTAVYIGQSNRLLERSTRHARDLDFWQHVSLAASAIGSLTTGQYLERGFVDTASKSGITELRNGARPMSIWLADSDRADMKYFAAMVFLLLPARGLDVFRKTSTARRPAKSS